MSRFKAKWVTEEEYNGSEEAGVGIADGDEVEEHPLESSVVVEEREKKKDKAIKSVKGYTDISKLKIEWPQNCLILGCTQCGKSRLARAIVYHNCSHFKRIIVISSSVKKNSDYDFLPDICKFDPNNFKDLVRFKKTIDLQRKVSEVHNHPMMVIVDDAIGSIEMHTGPIGQFFDRLSSTGRHDQISMLYITQRATKVSPCTRDNSLYKFIIKSMGNEVDSYIYGWQRQMTDLPSFRAYYDKITSVRYASMMIQNYNPYDATLVPIAPCDPNIKFALV